MNKPRILELMNLCTVARSVVHPDVFGRFHVGQEILLYTELEALLKCKLSELEREEEIKSQ